MTLARLLVLILIATTVFARQPFRVVCHMGRVRLTKQLPPIYPPDAKKNGQAFDVLLELVIARDGRVKELKVVKGRQPFVEAASTAVHQWIFEPSKLNGDPVEVVTRVTVRFHP